MKNSYFIVASSLLISGAVQAQSSKNEVKINLLGAVTGLPEISYERLLTQSTGLGISMAKGISGNHKNEFQFLAIPYYRFYFGTKEAQGFFGEGHTAIAYGKENSPIHESGQEEAKLGLGLAIGYKLLTKHNLLAEINLGAGKYFNGSDVIDYPRFGISIGKRL